mmetsp:Transcript_1593/g.5623  ORF Transcript_1593/g.5623 Transcript_1593/m.5623 type:complete len:266 (-) Transcript_1593:80-877(-)
MVLHRVLHVGLVVDVVSRVSLVLELSVEAAGLHQEHVDAPGHQFHAECVRDGLHGVLGSGVDARARQADPAGPGAEVDHARLEGPSGAVLAEERDKGLRDPDEADDVDLHLAANAVEGNALDWAVLAVSCVVDECEELPSARLQRLRHLTGGLCNLLLVRNVANYRMDVLGLLSACPHLLAVSLLPYANEHCDACVGQASGKAVAKARRAARNHDCEVLRWLLQPLVEELALGDATGESDNEGKRGDEPSSEPKENGPEEHKVGN